MVVYLGVLGLLLLNCGIYETNKKRKYSRGICFFFAALMLFFVSGFRYMVGTDYQTYMKTYHSYKTEDITLFNQPALNIIARISAVIYDDYATWFLIMSAITIGFSMAGIYKHSISIWFSLLLFLFVGCWHESFNGVKQYAAIAILFFAYDNIQKRKFWVWTVYCLVATLFHVSAIVMIPIYFLVSKKEICLKQCFIIIIVGIVLSLAQDYLFDFAALLKGGENITESDSEVALRSVKWQRVLVSIAPIALFLIFKDYFDFKDEKLSILFYFSFLNAVLFIFCSSSVYLSRICLFTNIFNTLFIPYLVKPFKNGDKIFVISVILLLYGIFWVYDLMKIEELKNFYWIWER